MNQSIISIGDSFFITEKEEPRENRHKFLRLLSRLEELLIPNYIINLPKNAGRSTDKYLDLVITKNVVEYNEQLLKPHRKTNIKAVGFLDYETVMLRKAKVEKEAKELFRRGYVGVTLW